MQSHGPNYDWKYQPIDGNGLYRACNGKPQGRFGICDGLVITPSVLSDVKTRASSGETPQRARKRLDREVDATINKTIEDRLSQLEECNRVQNHQAQEQIHDQVSTAVHATNEYWLKYIQVF